MNQNIDSIEAALRTRADAIKRVHWDIEATHAAFKPFSPIEFSFYPANAQPSGCLNMSRLALCDYPGSRVSHDINQTELRARLDAIKRVRGNHPTPSLADIEATHTLFVSPHFEPYYHAQPCDRYIERTVCYEPPEPPPVEHKWTKFNGVSYEVHGAPL